MTILLILLIFLAIVGIRLYKVWKDAGYLEETVDLQHFSYEVELKLDKKKLSSSLTGTLDAIAEITGLEEKDVYHLKIKGSVYGEVIHAEIYPYSSKAPITDIYLGKNGNVINGATIYNAMRKEFVEGDDRLEELLPEWEGAEYMTADQLGLMLEANLKDISRFSFKTEKLKLSKTQYLIALAVMKKEKSSYTLKLIDNLKAGVKVKEGEVTVQASTERLNKVIEDLNDKMSIFDISIKADNLNVIKEVSLEVTFKDGKKLKMPKETISQRDLEAVVGVRSLIREYTGR